MSQIDTRASTEGQISRDLQIKPHWYWMTDNWTKQGQDERFEKLSPKTRCLCRGCGQFFNSVSLFDVHRMDDNGTRICLTPVQMLTRGHLLNKYGFWIAEHRPD